MPNNPQPQQQQPDPMLAAFQRDAATDAATEPWKPQQRDPTHHIQIGDNHYLIHSDDLSEAQRRVPDLIVHTQVTSGDPMLDAFVATKKAIEAGVPDAAAQPGAYQQTKEQAQAHIVHNVNADNQILHDENGNWTGQYLMKRDDETHSQFLARAIEAGRHVTPQMIQQEHQKNKRNAPLALGVAAAAGPAILGAETLAAAPFVAASTPALAITGETTGEMIVGPSLARQEIGRAHV